MSQKLYAISVLRELAVTLDPSSEGWTILVNAARHLHKNVVKRRRNRNARERYAAIKSLGLTKTTYGWE
jgi:hypothetical protein